MRKGEASYPVIYSPWTTVKTVCTSGLTGQRTADDDKARERGIDGRRLKTARGVAPAALLQGSARPSIFMRAHVQDRNPVLAHSLRQGRLPAQLPCTEHQLLQPSSCGHAALDLDIWA